MKSVNLLKALSLPLLLTTFLVSLPVEAAKKPAAGSVTQQGLENLFTADELKDMAAASRKSGNTVNLIAALKGWAAHEPNRFDVRLELGTLYVSLNKFPDAIRILNEASAIIPSDEAPHRLLAQVYRRQGNDSLRCFHLIKAASLAQRNWENQFNLAAYYISKGRIPQAEKLLVRTMELNGAFAPAKFEYAKLMLDRNDTETAFRKFGEALNIEPENALYQAWYAYAASVSGRGLVAKESIAEALRVAPKNPKVLYLSGLIHINNGNFSAAEQTLRAAMRYSPTDMAALESLGDVLAADFKFKEACGAYLTVWQNAGYSERVACKLGKALAGDEKFREAKDFFEAVAAKNPKHGEALYRLTEAYCELGDMRQAHATLARIGGDRNPVWYQAAQGRIHEAQSDPDLAWTAYSAAHVIDPRNAHVNAGLGRMLFKQAEFDSAIAYFETAAALDPSSVENIVGKAKACEEKGNYDDALGIYESIIIRSPQRPDVYLSIAAIKEERGNTRDAIKCVTKGLEANGGDANLLFCLGRLYQATKQYEEAIGAYEASIGRKANSGNVEALRIIGDIYYSKLTNEKKAKEYFKKYVRAGGDDSLVEDVMKKLSNKAKT